MLKLVTKLVCVVILEIICNFIAIQIFFLTIPVDIPEK